MANAILKASFVVTQILFVVFGLVLVGVGVWLEIQDQDFRPLVGGQEFLYGAYLIIAAGCAIAVVSVVGMVGALCETKINKFLLGFYIILVGLVFIAELAGAIVAFVYRDQAEEILLDTLNQTLFIYGENSTEGVAAQEGWDAVQRTFNCCGIQSPQNWTDNRNVIPGLSDNDLFFPVSCCQDETSEDCGMIGGVNDIKQEPCLGRILEVVDNNLLVVAALGIAFLVGEILVILVAGCLLCFGGND